MTIPLAVAEEARAMFLRATDWGRVEQSEEDYYRKRALYPGQAIYPGLEDETYTASFWLSRQLEHDLSEIFYQHVLPNIGLIPKGGVHLHPYRMEPGDHYRLHVDDQGETGFIWYLSKGWKPDWGGLLIQTHTMKITVPEFNTLVVRKAYTPHCVTTIEKWAKEPRLMLVGFF